MRAHNIADAPPRRVQGTQIEGTFWRDMAVRMDGALHEGRIYLFSNGTVSPSNRRYSSVDNDYKINFSETKSDVREAPVQARRRPVPSGVSLSLALILFVAFFLRLVALCTCTATLADTVHMTLCTGASLHRVHA